MIYFLSRSEESLRQLLEKMELNQASFIEMIISMSIAFTIGLLIFFIYRICFKGTVYNYFFNVSLLILTLITAMIILTISSNIVLSLGMVGALSIVRFRSALKDPVDIVYIFWAISAGLAAGAAQYLLALVGSAFISIALLLLTRATYSIHTYIITLKYGASKDVEVTTLLNQFKTSLKSKYIEHGQVELTLEIKKKHQEIMDALNKMDELDHISILSFEE